jgi:hypothetical protein
MVIIVRARAVNRDEWKWCPDGNRTDESARPARVAGRQDASEYDMMCFCKGSYRIERCC